MLSAFLIAALPLIDRLRGGFFSDGKTYKRYELTRRLSLLEQVRPWAWAWVMGFAVATILGLEGITWFACAAGLWVGELSGWGKPLGRALFGYHMDPDKPDPWWQFTSDHWRALLVRGALWAVPAAVLTQGAALPLVPVFALSMWGGAQLGKHFQVEHGNAWGSSELFRGLLIGVGCGLT